MALLVAMPPASGNVLGNYLKIYQLVINIMLQDIIF